MTTELHVSTLAQRDLIDIYLYTLQQHGEPQAKRYLSELETRFHELAAAPSSARRVGDICPGAARALFEQHAIYFRHVPGRCTILRVLHQRMDPGRHIFTE